MTTQRAKYSIDLQGRFCAVTPDGTEFRTSPTGQGLWARRGGDWRQIEGACQFDAADLAHFARRLRARNKPAEPA